MSEATSATMERMPRSKVGQILLQHTSLKEDQLERALEIQKETGNFLGDILVQNKMIQPHELLKALCFQLDIPYLDDLHPDKVDALLVKDIPMNYARSREVVPIKVEEDPDGHKTFQVVIGDPFNENTIEDLRVILDGKIDIVSASPQKIQDAISRIYARSTTDLDVQLEGNFEEDLDLEGQIDILEANEESAPVIKFVNSVLARAVKEKASDIHIEPFEREFVIRFRVDGVLYDVVRQPKPAHAAISSRIKVMGSLDIAEKRLPQDGRIKRKIAGKEIDIRLSTVPTNYGERLVMRILEQSSTVLELEELGFRDRSKVEIEKLIERKFGIILVTGPTGSGKSTTLSACLVKLNSPDRNIMTVEDPIEYQIHGINQVQVNAKIELDFARALRAFLRQNPDIIMVGEIRDKETAEIAINASLTGHLVLSTIHTNDASGAATRLMDMGVEPFLISSSLLGVIAQRLIRRVCTQCRTPHTPTDFELEEMGLQSLPEKATVFKSNGCSQCSNSGYSGRTVIHELMVVSDEIRKLIVHTASADQIKKASIKGGMVTLREDGIAKVLAGITTIDELMRVTHAEEN